MAAAQEEAAVATAQAAEAQSRADTLMQRAQHDQQQRKAKLATGLDPTEIARLKDKLHRQLGAGSQASHEDQDVQALVDKVKAQRTEIIALQEALGVSNARRAQEAETSARLSTELAQSEKEVRELQATVSSLEQQLWQLQEQHDRLLHSRQHTEGAQLYSQGASSMGLGHLDAGLSQAASIGGHSMHTAGHSARSTGGASNSAGLQQLDAVVAVWRDTCDVQQQRIAELEATAAELELEVESVQARLAAAEAQVSQQSQRIRDLEEEVASQQQAASLTHEQVTVELASKQQQVRMGL